MDVSVDEEGVANTLLVGAASREAVVEAPQDVFDVLSLAEGAFVVHLRRRRGASLRWQSLGLQPAPRGRLIVLNRHEPAALRVIN